VVYLESGDHEHLVRLSREQLHELMSAARHGQFSRELMH